MKLLVYLSLIGGFMISKRLRQPRQPLLSMILNSNVFLDKFYFTGMDNEQTVTESSTERLVIR